MRFPYSVLPARPDAAFPNRQSIKRPVLTVLLERDGRSIAGLAIVDSGADNSIFPASIGTALGIAIPNPNTYVFSGTADAPQIAYFDTVSVTIWNGNATEQRLKFDLYTGFCDSLEHVGLGLLGQEGFFPRFQVLLHCEQNYFDIL
ncbi:MAG: hypothetical protein WAL85_04620 [Candidatus Korobacteraceae bacterium]